MDDQQPQVPCTRPTRTLYVSRSRIALIGILFLAAFLRFWNLDASEFKYDEARVCTLAADFVDTGVPPVRGMGSSLGIDNPPLTIYLMSLPVLFSRDPLIVTGFVALLNVVGVTACYWLGKRYWGTGVGLLAAALLAASPWAVFYSRKVWAQNLLLPFVILYFGCLLLWIVQERPWALSGAIIALAALIQIHMATVAFVPLFGLVLLSFLVTHLRRGRAAPLWKPLLVGVAASALLYLPYITFDAFTGWENVRAFLEMSKSPAQIHWQTLDLALLNIGGRQIHALAGPQRFQDFLASILNLRYWPDRIEEVLCVASLVYLLLRLWRQRQNREALARDGLLLLWLLAPPLFYLRSRSPVFPHYLISLYPAPFLVLGIGAIDLLRAVRSRRGIHKAVCVLGTVMLISLLAWQSYLSLSVHAFVEVRDTPGGMGTPIGLLRAVTHTVERLATAWNSDQVVILCPGDNPAIDECPAVLDFVTRRKLDVRFVDYDSALLFPRSETDTLIVLGPGESIAAQALPRHAKVCPGQTVWLRERTGAYRFYRLPASYAPLPETQPDSSPARLENGVMLLGYALPPLTSGQAAQLALYWHVEEVPDSLPPRGYSFAIHVLGGDGQRYGQGDRPSYDVNRWRAGDTFESWFQVSLPDEAPPAPYALGLGMYVHTPPDQFEGVPVIDDTGQPIGDSIRWPIE
jgi:4-amino-4-deoxy-L-arabinose transferase-like glycosyltransferase